VPNSTEAIKKNLDRYLVSIDELELVTGEIIPVADYAKHDKSRQSWMIPGGCNIRVKKHQLLREIIKGCCS
jgi:endonuclease G